MYCCSRKLRHVPAAPLKLQAHDLGMGVTYLDAAGSQMGNKESIEDTARVLGRMFDGIEYRGYGQEIVDTLAEYAGVPVWNGLTNECHPTQTIADLLTIRENFGSFEGLKLVFMGDAKIMLLIRLWWVAQRWALRLLLVLRISMPDPNWLKPVKKSLKNMGAKSS